MFTSQAEALEIGLTNNSRLSDYKQANKLKALQGVKALQEVQTRRKALIRQLRPERTGKNNYE